VWFPIFIVKKYFMHLAQEITQRNPGFSENMYMKLLAKITIMSSPIRSMITKLLCFPWLLGQSNNNEDQSRSTKANRISSVGRVLNLNLGCLVVALVLYGVKYVQICPCFVQF
jgi:hypothetical protein